jgi:hypothetical protein
MTTVLVGLTWGHLHHADGRRSVLDGAKAGNYLVCAGFVGAWSFLPTANG